MPPAPQAHGRLLGRDRELALLRERLGLEPAGSGGAVLVGGDAGLGKTRLLVELVDGARAEGWRVMVGHCLDFADSLLPYLPFSELVGRLADEDPETATWLAEQHPAITALAPGRRLMSDAEPVGSLDRATVFEGMHAALETLATRSPVLVVVEDLHWADQSTRDLLSFLFARPFRGRVALVASYRSEDLHRRHPLRAALAQWARVRGVDRLQLEPLADPDVRRLVRSLAPGTLPEREVARIVARAEGNAFFAEELVAAGAAAGIPDDLADLLLVRLDRLDDAGRAVVRAAACAGRRVSHALLAAVVDVPDLEAALRGAVESHVLVRTGADSFGFRHALLAEAVHDDLLPGERARLHAAFVRVLTDGTVEGTAAELATHARAAHDVPTAVRAGIRAGEEAMAVGGPDDAATHFEAALDLASRGDADDVDLADLVIRTAEAVTASGHPARAKALLGDHLDRPVRAWSAHERARLLVAWSASALLNEVVDDLRIATGEALALVGEEPSRLRASALSLHAIAHAIADDDREAARYAGEALVMAQQLEVPRVVAEATTTLAKIDERSGDAEPALKALLEVADDARARGDGYGEMRGAYNLGSLHLERGLLAEAEEAFARAAAVAERLGQPWAPYGFDARFMQALTAYVRGRWDEVTALTDVSGQTPPMDPEALLRSLRMLLGAARGDATVLDSLESVRPSWPREAISAITSGAAAIELYGAAGDLASMRRVYDEVVQVVGGMWSPLFLGRVRLTALVLGQLADAAATPGAASELRAEGDRFADVVEAVVRRVEAEQRRTGPEWAAWVLRARAERLRLGWRTGEPVDLEAMLAAWRDTAAAFESYGQPYEAARSQARLAEALAGAGRAPEAAEVAVPARAVAVDLGAVPLVALLDQVARPAPAAAAGGLTAREHEILGLVAEGLSNGEIARRLFISTKTVSVHVSNILAKLGAASRTEAAAIGRRTGLLG